MGKDELALDSLLAGGPDDSISMELRPDDCWEVLQGHSGHVT